MSVCVCVHVWSVNTAAHDYRNVIFNFTIIMRERRVGEVAVDRECKFTLTTLSQI